MTSNLSGARVRKLRPSLKIAGEFSARPGHRIDRGWIELDRADLGRSSLQRREDIPSTPRADHAYDFRIEHFVDQARDVVPQVGKRSESF